MNEAKRLTPAIDSWPHGRDIIPVALDTIDLTPYEMRHSYGNESLGEGLGSLAASMQARGQLAPVGLVIKSPEVEDSSHVFSEYKEGDVYKGGERRDLLMFDLVFGRRRCEAARQLGWKSIQAIILADTTPLALLSLAIAENADRANLTITERAEAEARLKALYAEQGECSYRHEGRIISPDKPTFSEIRAAALNVSARTVENWVALGEAHPDVRHAVDTGLLSASAGYYAASAYDPALHPDIIRHLHEKGAQGAQKEDVRSAALVVSAGTAAVNTRSGETLAPLPEAVIFAARGQMLERVVSEAKGFVDWADDAVYSSEWLDSEQVYTTDKLLLSNLTNLRAALAELDSAGVVITDRKENE